MGSVACRYVSSPVTLAVVGAGGRGTGYADWALANPDRARVVAVAEPRDARRTRFAADHRLDPRDVVTDWRQLAERPRVADAVLICTQDRMHVEPAVAFAEAGYDILLEKPMAPTEAECRRIVAAAMKAGVIFAVGHVMRYTPYTQALKRVLDSGVIGEVMSVQHLEPVGFWHQAHSYVRGNWRNTAESTFMLMAKSCHDLDWLQYMMGEPPARVSSFGRLSHFRPENKPAGAADRCLDCGVEPDCPYSAKRLYFDALVQGRHRFPLSALVDEYTPEALGEALRNGPYGRCVYACDNDVVDHQVVSMEFGSGATGTFTMTAFNEAAHRRTRLFGTRGEIDGDGELIRVYDFLTRTERVVGPGDYGDMTAGGGHGGGDAGLMDAFTAAVAAGDPGLVLSGPLESLTSHLSVFAAEQARLRGTVEQVPPALGLVPTGA